MTSQMDFCEQLANAPSAEAELATFDKLRQLPPPMRSLRYGIRRLSDGAILEADEFAPDMFDQVEVVLYCDKAGTEHEVVWRPKSMENLELLLRE